MNRGFRVQFNSALGPYKGGLRFHPSVNLSIIKFLGFEQIFKNALTGLPMGGGKGGADFDPKGKSDAEVMRFCQSFMTELSRHIGPDTDVPAGDIGVGGREIGYMFGQYKRLKNRFDAGVLTGKGLTWGGSFARTEATGYGLVYFAAEMLAAKGTSFDGKRVVVSGSGTSRSTRPRRPSSWARPSSPFPTPPATSSTRPASTLRCSRTSRRCVVDASPTTRPSVPAPPSWLTAPSGTFPVTSPCRAPPRTSCRCPAFRASSRTASSWSPRVRTMPTTPDAIEALQAAGVAYAPGKASNAGGVATSGLEMQQNSGRTQWPFEETDAKLHQIMVDIHATLSPPPRNTAWLATTCRREPGGLP